MAKARIVADHHEYQHAATGESGHLISAASWYPRVPFPISIELTHPCRLAPSKATSRQNGGSGQLTPQIFDHEQRTVLENTRQRTVTTQFPAHLTPEDSTSQMQSKIPTAKHKFEGHEREIYSFVFLHDNVHVVSGSLDGTMRKWNCDTGRLVGEPWKGEGRLILALALSPDGKTIACGRGNGSVQRWDTDGKMKSTWTGHSNSVESLSWSPSGDHIASGSYNGTILIREAESGKVDVGPIKTNQDWVRSLAYSPLGDRIASGGNNKIICI